MIKAHMRPDQRGFGLTLLAGGVLALVFALAIWHGVHQVVKADARCYFVKPPLTQMAQKAMAGKNIECLTRRCRLALPLVLQYGLVCYFSPAALIGYPPWLNLSP